MSSTFFTIVLCIMLSFSCAYDASPHQYHPSGTILQLERAKELAQRGNPVIGIKCQNGIAILMLTRESDSKLIIEGPKKYTIVDKHILFIYSGLLSDSIAVSEVIKSSARRYRSTYMSGIPIEHLLDDLSSILHDNTIKAGSRPLGLRILVGGYDEYHNYQLYTVEPEGYYTAWKCICIGSGTYNRGSSIQNRIENKMMSLLEDHERYANCDKYSLQEILPELFSDIQRILHTMIDQDMTIDGKDHKSDTNNKWKIQVLIGSKGDTYTFKGNTDNPADNTQYYHHHHHDLKWSLYDIASSITTTTTTATTTTSTTTTNSLIEKS